MRLIFANVRFVKFSLFFFVVAKSIAQENNRKVNCFIVFIKRIRNFAV